MIAVWTTHRRPFRVGERTYDPVVATLVPEIDGAMRLQAANLRTLEVSGPEDPKLRGARLRNERGEPIETDSVSAVIVAERDDLKRRLEAMETSHREEVGLLRELLPAAKTQLASYPVEKLRKLADYLGVGYAEAETKDALVDRMSPPAPGA